MNNDSYSNTKTKNEGWFSEMYNNKIECLHEKSPCGSILNYISCDDFKKKYFFRV